jgi:coenzyme PQQ precursor peptide PqqA
MQIQREVRQMKQWKKPAFVEIAMDCEINSYMPEPLEF